jgi:hypothetical protein
VSLIKISIALLFSSLITQAIDSKANALNAPDRCGDSKLTERIPLSREWLSECQKKLAIPVKKRCAKKLTLRSSIEIPGDRAYIVYKRHGILNNATEIRSPNYITLEKTKSSASILPKGMILYLGCEDLSFIKTEPPFISNVSIRGDLSSGYSSIQSYFQFSGEVEIN